MIGNNIIQTILFCIIVFIINNLIISVLCSLSTGKNVVYSFISNYELLLINILAVAPFGVILTIVFEQYKYLGVLLLLGPIILIKYTFSLYIDSKSKYVQTVDALMRAMEARDKYTEGHSQRVASLASSIAKELGYNEWKIEQLNIASLLHDVGKIGIDDSILNKPGKLTEEEFEAIKKHPEIGYNILKDINGLKNIVSIARYHHERYDGKGYPSGKSADELDFDVFIVQLADAVDAMTTDRPYRKALSEDEILNEVKKHSGTQFHPKVVEAYLRMAEKQKKVV
jgi:putative nucleotidyltransferase with HDIG domain